MLDLNLDDTLEVFIASVDLKKASLETKKHLNISKG